MKAVKRMPSKVVNATDTRLDTSSDRNAKRNADLKVSSSNDDLIAGVKGLHIGM